MQLSLNGKKMVQAEAYPASNWWTNPERWVSIGFLVAIFFAPWGSGLRYFGWVISLVALLVMRSKGQLWDPVLDRRVAWILGGLLIFGALTTAVMKQNAFLWAKGFSLLVEFAFSIWLAAWVFRNKENGVLTWLQVWYAGTVAFLVWGFVQFLGNPGGDALFSNRNSLGLYICLILPLLLGVAFRKARRPFILKAFQFILAGIGVFLLFLSFSLSAWVAGGLQLLLSFLFLPQARRILAGLLAGLVLIAWVVVLVSPTESPVGVIKKKFADEAFQVQTLLRPAAESSTKSRLDIARVAAQLIRERPFLGWGWGHFNKESERFIDHPDFMSMHPEAFAGNAHSMYLNLWVMGGILALTGVCLVHALGLLQLIKKYRFSHESEVTVPAIILLISIFLYSLGGDVFGFRYKAAVLFWSVLGFACKRDREGLGDEAS
ncbi:MAG: O-antigen ligase family protein [Desulfobulbaceae bacterium]|nr:O-antigen ligase family protein [Desulfobulbaceae bacterium]